jgi:hypothetical protein
MVSAVFFFPSIHDFVFQFCNMEKLVTFPKKIAKLFEFKFLKKFAENIANFFSKFFVGKNKNSLSVM